MPNDTSITARELLERVMEKWQAEGYFPPNTLISILYVPEQRAIKIVIRRYPISALTGKAPNRFCEWQRLIPLEVLSSSRNPEMVIDDTMEEGWVMMGDGHDE